MRTESSKFGESFKYDFVLSLNALLKIRQKHNSIVKLIEGKSILAATLNHRFFNLDDKNYIKAYIDAHNIDHIMFSIRPSAASLIREFSKKDILKFTYYSQIIFVLQMLGRYEISSAIVDLKNAGLNYRSSVQVEEITNNIIGFVDWLKEKIPMSVNFAKHFPILNSVLEILPKIQECSLLVLDSFENQKSTIKYNDKQINRDEKDLFWLGFDHEFKQVPHNKVYPKTRWTNLIKGSAKGKGLFEKELKYCARCCLPETMEGMKLDEIGICIPCRSSEEKMHMNWEKKREILDSIIDSYRSDNYYDCMLPMSGGKDSTYQAYLLDKVLNLTPLAVTHGQNWFSLDGRYNLENCLQKFDLDHLIFFKNRSVINKVARKSLDAIGDACWHCHIGSGTLSIQSAIAWNVGLMLWGESTAQADPRGSYAENKEASLVYNLDISARIPAENLTDEITPTKDMCSWYYPPNSELKKNDISYCSRSFVLNAYVLK